MLGAQRLGLVENGQRLGGASEAVERAPSLPQRGREVYGPRAEELDELSQNHLGLREPSELDEIAPEVSPDPQRVEKVLAAGFAKRVRVCTACSQVRPDRVCEAVSTLYKR